MDEQKGKSNHFISGKIKKVCAIVILAGVAVFIGVVLLSGGFGKGRKKEIITKSTLEQIINVSELSTVEAVYNGITEVMNKENPKNIDYYVYYEAKVKAGIDFEKVRIDIDNEAKKIVLTIPDIEINEVSVDITTLDYIFENDKADTGTVSQEAYKAAIQDVTQESANEAAIYQIAEQNAKNIVEALVSPFVKQLDAEYVLEIN